MITKIDPQLELDLLTRIRAGDSAACNECVEIHSPPLYRLVLRMVEEPMEAEDIVQDTFLNAFRAIGEFDGRSRLGTWLFRIAYNTALMHLRKASPITVPVDEPVTPQDGEETLPVQLFDWCCLPEDDLLRSEALRQVGKAIEELPATLRDVFIMREFEGLSTLGVAESLQLSESAVKVRLHRARQALRSRLEEYFGDQIDFDPKR